MKPIIRKGTDIKYDCSCPIPRVTNNTNPMMQITQCECRGWLNDSEIIMGFNNCVEFIEIPSSEKHGTL